MASNSLLQKVNREGRIGAIFGFFASIIGIAFWIVLIYFNPYSSKGIDEDVMIRTFIGLALPAIIGVIGSTFRIKGVMYAVFIVSLPLSLYLAGTPGLFRIFFLVSLGYLLSAILTLAYMCKHVAAVLYGVGARLDEDPALFFELRKVKMENLISDAISEKTQTFLRIKSNVKSRRTNVMAGAKICFQPFDGFERSKRKCRQQYSAGAFLSFMVDNMYLKTVICQRESLYWPGVTPVCFLKTRMKFCMVLNPVLKPMSLIVRFVCIMSSLDFSTLNSFK